MFIRSPRFTKKLLLHRKLWAFTCFTTYYVYLMIGLPITFFVVCNYLPTNQTLKHNMDDNDIFFPKDYFLLNSVRGAAGHV